MGDLFEGKIKKFYPSLGLVVFCNIRHPQYVTILGWSMGIGVASPECCWRNSYPFVTANFESCTNVPYILRNTKC